MARPIHYGDDFAATLREEAAYLREREKPQWMPLLEADLAAAAQLLASFPHGGTSTARRGSRELRKIRLERTPFYVWYVFDAAEANGPVTFLRIFHMRQRARKSAF